MNKNDIIYKGKEVKSFMDNNESCRYMITTNIVLLLIFSVVFRLINYKGYLDVILGILYLLGLLYFYKNKMDTAAFVIKMSEICIGVCIVIYCISFIELYPWSRLDSMLSLYFIIMRLYLNMKV